MNPQTTRDICRHKLHTKPWHSPCPSFENLGHPSGNKVSTRTLDGKVHGRTATTLLNGTKSTKSAQPALPNSTIPPPPPTKIRDIKTASFQPFFQKNVSKFWGFKKKRNSIGKTGLTGGLKALFNDYWKFYCKNKRNPPICQMFMLLLYVWFLELLDVFFQL